MTRLLLTGSSGALGRYLKQHILEHNDQVEFDLALLSRQAAEDEHFKSFQANFLDQDSMDKVLDDFRPDCIIHTAWETAHGTYWNDETNLDWADATLHVASRFAELGGQYFQFAGTCAEYTWGDDLLIENVTTENPHTLYGQQKCRTTRQLMSLMNDKKLDVCCGRIFFPFSPLENSARVTTHVISSLLDGRPVHLNAGDVLRDMMHTRHVASALMNLLQKRATGLFNISSGQATHLGKFLQQVAEAMGKEELLTWDEFQPGEHPQSIVGSASQIAPYLPAEIDLKADIIDLIEGIKAKSL